LTSDRFLSPPHIYNAKKQERKVGFEIEFSGLKIDQIAHILKDIFEGDIQKITPFKYKVITPEYGVFGVELDFRFLKEELLKEELEKLGLIDADDVKFIRHIEELIAAISETVVPYEIVTPPLFVTQLHMLDILEEILRQHGALGTGASFLYAFGLHINPEVPSFEVTVLLRYLRAFFVLYEWLVYTSRTDFIRRLTPYITPFDNEYTKLVLDPSYNPDINRFMDDYLYYNPTRNRPLDLLPLFKFIDKEKVEAVVDDPRIKERPTFHYRLPDCRIDTEVHNIAHAWNRWVAVEQLAEDEIRLNSMAERYLEYLEDPFSIFEEEWALQIEKWQNK
jgi:hypothetical protein